MSLGSGTNTVQKSDPWSKAQPYLQDIMGQAQNLYQQGGEYAPFATNATMSPWQTSALQNINNYGATAAGQINDATQGIAGIANQGLLNNQNVIKNLAQNGLSYNAANDYLKRATAANAATPLASTAATSPQQNYAQQYLSGMAANQGTNPQLQGMLDTLNRNITDSVNSQFGTAGRTGSAYYQNALAQQIGSADTNLLYNAYNTDQANQLSAANSIQSAYNTGQGNNLNAISLLGNLGQQQSANQLTAAAQRASNAQNSANLQLSAANTNQQNQLAQQNQELTANAMLPALQNQQYQNYQNQFAAGQQYQTQAQNQINDELSRWNYGQTAPSAALGQYNAAVQGFAGAGSQSSSTTNSSLLPSLLGLGGAALSSGSLFGGSAGGLLGGGASLGLLGSLFGGGGAGAGGVAALAPLAFLGA